MSGQARVYWTAFAALLALLGATVGAAFVPYARFAVPGLGVAVAFGIATVKAAVIALYFMHVRGASRLTRAFVVLGLLWLAILFVLTLTDYVSRAWLPASSGWRPEVELRRP